MTDVRKGFISFCKYFSTGWLYTLSSAVSSQLPLYIKSFFDSGKVSACIPKNHIEALKLFLHEIVPDMLVVFMLLL